MTLAEFQARAYAVGIVPRVSGSVLFFARGGTTVRVRQDDKGTHYAVSFLNRQGDIEFRPCTSGQASKALHLPRR